MSLNLHKTENFSVNYISESRILQGNFSRCECSDDFTHAIKSFKEVYDKVSPKYTFWDCSDFHYVIPQEEQKWVDTFLNLPATKDGVYEKKVAKILSQDLMAMQSIVEVFENGKAPIICGYFVAEQQALNWLTQKNNPSFEPTKQTDPELSLRWNLTEYRVDIILEIDKQDISYYLKKLKHLLQDHKFAKQHYKLFQSLTVQEKRVLSLIAKGNQNKEIADEFNISIETVKTHRKNLVRKLNCRSMTELMRYKDFI